MKLSSHKLLKRILDLREASLDDLMPIIEIKFDDYRDYYPLALLCSAGYVKNELSMENEMIRDEKRLASIFYSVCSGQKKVNNYNAPNNPSLPSEIFFHVTPKAELYFAESNAKRSDRIYGMAIAIMVGLVTAILTVKLGLK